jgi:putative hydrolase of the HAD superfamily
MRALREQVFAEHPHLAHDFTALRKISLDRAFAGSGLEAEWTERAFEVFYAARNEVELYEEVAEALEKLAERWPLASLTNGNADLVRIGLARHFRAFVHAREHGCAKPTTRLFHIAAEALGVAPSAIAHVGDDPRARRRRRAAGGHDPGVAQPLGRAVAARGTAARGDRDRSARRRSKARSTRGRSAWR